MLEHTEPEAGAKVKKDAEKSAEEAKIEGDAILEKKIQDEKVKKQLEEEKFEDAQAAKKAADEE